MGPDRCTGQRGMAGLVAYFGINYWQICYARMKKKRLNIRQELEKWGNQKIRKINPLYSLPVVLLSCSASHDLGNLVAIIDQISNLSHVIHLPVYFSLPTGFSSTSISSTQHDPYCWHQIRSFEKRMLL